MRLPASIYLEPQAYRLPLYQPSDLLHPHFRIGTADGVGCAILQTTGPPPFTYWQRTPIKVVTAGGIRYLLGEALAHGMSPYMWLCHKIQVVSTAVPDVSDGPHEAWQTPGSDGERWLWPDNIAFPYFLLDRTSYGGSHWHIRFFRSGPDYTIFEGPLSVARPDSGPYTRIYGTVGEASVPSGCAEASWWDAA
jgi:hypothetical protein